MKLADMREYFFGGEVIIELMRRKIYSVIISLIFALTAFLTVLILVFISEKVHQKEQALKAYSVVRSVVEDANNALDELNLLFPNSCDKNTLIEMQRVLFRSQFIKEVSFLKDGLIICTTSGGKLEEPFPKYLPTYTTPRKTQVFIDHSYDLFFNDDAPSTAIIAELGVFNVVIHGGFLDFVDIQLGQWQVLYFDGNKAHHIQGLENIYRPQFGLKNVSHFLLSHGLYTQVCDNNLGYCASATKSTSEIINSNRSLLLISLSFMFAIFWLFLRWLYPFEARISSLQYRIKTGMESGAFYPSYQPIVRLSSEDLVGCEVLGRYKDRFGELYPDQFIPLLKEYGMTWKYTIHQVTHVCDQLAGIRLPNDFKVGFNIFPEDLKPKNIDELIAITKHYLEYFKINFEIVEDIILDQFESKEQIKKLTSAGFYISIDDFGTGYSNLGQLQSISCHYLKIDRQFIGDIEKGSLLSSLVPQISEIANQFNLECVAEGIETSVQKDLLQAQGIEFGQGWYFGKPMTFDQWSIFMTSKLFRSRCKSSSINHMDLSAETKREICREHKIVKINGPN
jgi:sensor c-di-GMP phosphodiesterase-like protein